MASSSVEYPNFDGHFWVERNGEIIDPFFEEYGRIKVVRKCVGKAIYLPASDLVQTIMTKKMKTVDDINGIDDKFFRMFYNKVGMNRCWQNARLEILKNGGKLVFGSMGWKISSGGIHYEFGGENWSVAQHLLK